jgi:hypothetical protein
VLAGVAGAVLVGLCAWRLHRWRHRGAAHTIALPPGVARAARPLPPAQQRTIEHLGELHLHLHGITAEDVAAIIERHRHDG